MSSHSRFGNIAASWLFVLCILFEGGTWSTALTNTGLAQLVGQCKTAKWDLSRPECAGMPSWNTRGVTDMASLFAGADTFNIDISGWDTTSVTTMAAMFNGASSFNVDISRWNTASVRNIHWMFWGASSFNIDISGWQTSRVTTMYMMFRDASKFNVDLSGWDTRSVPKTDFVDMFTGSPKLSLGDVNECLGQSPCAEATCSNTDGSFTCTCSPGFVDWSVPKDGTSCDINQCTDDTLNNCAANAGCTDTEGSFTCACNSGFVDWSTGKIGTNCDANQCTDGTHNCAAKEQCVDTESGFTCPCKSGWTANNDDAESQCEDVDECTTETHNCDQENAVCQNTEGSFTCTCSAWHDSVDGGVTCTPFEEVEVKFTTELDMTREKFEQSEKARYKSAVASVAGVSVDKVHTFSQAGLQRRLLAAGVVVHTTVDVKASRASAASSTLASNLQSALASQRIRMLSFTVDAPAAGGKTQAPLDDASDDSGGPPGATVAAICVGVAFVVSVVAAVVLGTRSCLARCNRPSRKVACEPNDGKTQCDLEKGVESTAPKSPALSSTSLRELEPPPAGAGQTSLEISPPPPALPPAEACEIAEGLTPASWNMESWAHQTARSSDSESKTPPESPNPNDLECRPWASPTASTRVPRSAPPPHSGPGPAAAVP